jgi:hypothetical protein
VAALTNEPTTHGDRDGQVDRKLLVYCLPAQKGTAVLRWEARAAISLLGMELASVAAGRPIPRHDMGRRTSGVQLRPESTLRAKERGPK